MKSAFFIAALLAALRVHANEPTTAATTMYAADFFEQFGVRTALDMVERVPSFALRTVDEKRRGFSGAAGNVLIDGRQPAAKSQPIEDILQRIPASQVVRIELWRGVQTAGDASGDAVLINVVRTASAGAGVWATGFEYAQQDEAAPNGYLSWAGRIGQLDYGLGARGYSLKRELPGTRTLRDGEGNLVEIRQETSPREFYEYAIDGELSRDLFGGIFRGTGQAYRSHYEQSNTLDRRTPQGVLLGDELAPYAEGKETWELGVHFASAVAGWPWTIAGIFTRTSFDADAAVTNRGPSGAVESVFDQLQLRETGESILRATMDRTLSTTQQLQFGLEGARNTLDATLDLTGSFGGGPNISIDVPNDNIHLKEDRTEAFVLHTWRENAWSTEAKLAAEYSRLNFTGDVSQTVDLSYVKPSLQVSRTIAERHQIRVRIAREVEQLDFTDFASAVSLSDELVEGGNPDLKPQTSWNLELGLDLRFTSDAALGLRAYHGWLDDVVDWVRLGATDVSAPGNIGTGKLTGAQITLTTPLPAGATFKLDATFQEALVDDPITGRERTISGFERNQIKAELRQDIRYYRLAWGLKYAHASSTIDYRIDEMDRERASPSLDIYLERDITNGIKANLSVISILATPERRRRTYFESDRAETLISVEDFERRPGSWVMLTLSGAL